MFEKKKKEWELQLESLRPGRKLARDLEQPGMLGLNVKIAARERQEKAAEANL